jgi:MOSC domain-containing protein YiiM
MELLHFYVSSGHNFFGHHGGPAGNHPVLEPSKIQCVRGRGIEGDRFFDHKDNYKGQITFLEDEVYSTLCAQLNIWDKPASALRRNVITRGVDLLDWVGRDFTIQGVRFHGVEECKPCYWMDQAFGPGAEEALKGRGGLRAQILTTGSLQLTRQLSRQRLAVQEAS